MKARTSITLLLVVLLQLPLLAATLAPSPSCCCMDSCCCPADTECAVSTPQPEGHALLSGFSQLELYERSLEKAIESPKPRSDARFAFREIRGRDPTELILVFSLDLPPPTLF